MKKIFILMAAFGIVAAGTASVQADPATDLKQFREYFKKKFPTVKFDDYAIGIYGLPGMEDYRSQWDAINEFPPYELEMEGAHKEWNTPFKDGKTYASCFKNGGKNVAQHYPYWDDKTNQVRTVEMDLMQCLKTHNETRPFLTADLTKDGKARTQLAALTAVFYEMSKGQRVSIDVSKPGAVQAYEDGKKFFWARRGQLNFACSNCHMDLAGKNLGGNQPLSAALGHPVGWPAYRAVWGQLETIHHRYRTCNVQVRAKPAKHSDKIYDHLQLYETYLSSGLPLSAPSVRN